MKFRLIVAALAILLLTSQIYGGETFTLKSQKEKASYFLGVEVGKDFKIESIDIDPDILAKGIKDAFSGAKSLLTEEEGRETMALFQKEIIERRKAVTEKNKREGEAFLAENKKREGIKLLPDGLQYRVIRGGNGKTPKPMDRVEVHYRGTFVDETEFATSYSRKEPTIFWVEACIPGWTEALSLMQEGAKWQLFIPSDLAYGERGVEGSIGPNATLIFELELISIL